MTDHGYLDRDAAACAADRGLKLVSDHPRLLLIDLDTPEQSDRYFGAWSSGMFSAEIWKTYTTVSQHGRTHVYCLLYQELDVGVRIAMQTLMGSDPKRTELDLLRLARSIDAASNVLFETEHYHRGVLQWLAGNGILVPE